MSEYIDGVKLIENKEDKPMDEVIDLLGDDDFDQVFNVDELSSPRIDNDTNDKDGGYSSTSYPNVKSEVTIATITASTSNSKNITGGKRKADTRSPPPAEMVSRNQSAKKKSKTSESNLINKSDNDSKVTNNTSAEVTDLTNLQNDGEVDEEKAAQSTPSRQGKTNTILKRIGISDIDEYKSKQRRSNRIEKLRIIRDSERAKEQLLEELTKMRSELARSDRVQMNLFRKVDSMEMKASTAMENVMTLKQEKRNLEKTLSRRSEDLRKKTDEINVLKQAVKTAEKKASTAASSLEKERKKDISNLVEKKLLTQAREETKKAKMLCISLEKKVAALGKKTDTLTKSLANSASNRKRSIEEYKSKLALKEKELKNLKIESKNLVDGATDAATEMMANLQEKADTSIKQIAKLEKALQQANQKISSTDTQAQLIENLTEQLQSANMKLKGQEEVVEEMLNEEREKFEKDKANLEKAIAKWKTKYDELNNLSSEQAKEGSIAGKALQARLEEVTEEVRELKGLQNDLQSAVARKDAEIEASNNEATKWKTKYDELNNLSSEQAKEGSIAGKALQARLEEVTKEVRELKGLQNDLQSAVARKDTEIEAIASQFKSAKNSLANNVERLEAQLLDAKKQASSQQNANKQRKREIAELKSELESKIQELKILSNENENLKSSSSSTSGLQSKISNLNTEIEKLKTKNQLVTKELEVTRERSKKFWKATKRLQLELEASKKDNNNNSTSSSTSNQLKSSAAQKKANEAAILKAKLQKLAAKKKKEEEAAALKAKMNALKAKLASKQK
jgi:hypothetical protein